MTVYFFSGLGADERVFKKISIPQKWKAIHIKWRDVILNETIEDYCKKISAQIDTSEDFSFVGLSFGGVVAVELSKILFPQHLILVSSISNRNELSMFYRILNFIKLHKAIPAKLFTNPFFITYWAFGAKGKEEKALLKSIIKDTPPKFIKWAIDQIISWKNYERPANIFHIHGTSDRLFCIIPIRL